MKFTNYFDKFACLGDILTVELNGFDFTARIEFDGDHNIDDDDSHNVDQSVTGCDDEQQAKLIAAREAWFNDEWQYVGIVVSVARAGIVLDEHAASLWAIEMNYPGSDDNTYLTTVANDLLAEALEVGNAAIYKLTKV